MRRNRFFGVTALCGIVQSLCLTLVGGTVEFNPPAGRIAVDGANGAILGVWPKGAKASLWKSGEYGLWRVRFTNGVEVCANECATTKASASRGGTAFRYDHPLVTVSVEFVPNDTGVDLCGEVAAKTSLPALDIDLPARLRFAPDSVDRFYMPQKGNEGMGFALKAGFFAPAPTSRPTGWEHVRVKAADGHNKLFGGTVAMRPLEDPPVKVTVTEEGRRLLPPDVVDWMVRKSPSHIVNRACRQGQFDVSLVDSPHGPFLSGSHLGGTGTLWRVGTTEGADDAYTRSRLVAGLVGGLAKRKGRGSAKVAVVELLQTPIWGSFSGAPVAAYAEKVRAAAEKAGCAFETLRTAEDVRKALDAHEHLAIVSPYGEGFPVARVEEFPSAMDALKRWVREGGNWVEVGGASFFFAFVPKVYNVYARPYPNLFMDFFSLRTVSGAEGALFGVRPRPPHAPWKNDPENFFRPGTLGCGGDERGGYAEHAFRLWTKDGLRERLPAVRLALGLSLQRAVDAYAEANDLRRPLAEKMDAARLETLKRALFLKLDGTAAEMIALADRLPKPTTVHVTTYLKGGFDKQYPDHLPSNPKTFGTDADHLALIDALHRHGHLYSPYTNPTWWCDNPPGPSFVKAGRAPLAVGRDGKNYHEVYWKNDGWTITYWHPAVQEANRRTVRQFTRDLPVDLLFQDQCGARQFRYDFNPASPTPLAYTEGQLAMNEEDSATVPLGTEDGWDRAAECQVGLFGVSWYTVPLRLVPAVRHSRPLSKSQIPPDLWEFEPLAARLMHTRTLFWMHDLGSFVTCPRVFAWMLALGYNMSYAVSARTYARNEQVRGWAKWLGAVQGAVCARIAGQPLLSWRHDRSALLARKDISPSDPRDDGLVAARWGDVKCFVNLGDVPRTVTKEITLAPYGFHVTAPGLEAHALEGGEPTLVENGRTMRFSDFVGRDRPWNASSAW